MSRPPLSPIVQVTCEPYTKFLKSSYKDKNGNIRVIHYDAISLMYHQQSVLKHLDRTDVESMLEVPEHVHRTQNISDDMLIASCSSRRMQNPADIQHYMQKCGLDVENTGKVLISKYNKPVEPLKQE